MVQQTKSVSRYHAPEVKELLQILVRGPHLATLSASG